MTAGSTRLRGGYTAPSIRTVVWIAVALALVTSLMSAEAQAAKRVKSRLIVEVFGIIENDASVTYAFAGQVLAGGGLEFQCMGGRTVTLFRVESDGTTTPVASDKTDVVGFFVKANLGLPIDEIPGRYYAEVEEKKKKTNHGKLKCLAARSPTFLVEVPAGLLTPP